MSLSYVSPNDTVFTVRNVQVKFGEGVASEVGYETKRMGAKKVLIVTDKNISKSTDILSTIKDSLEKSGVGFDVFDSSPVEPIDTAFMKGLESIKGSTYDGFIGVGGGSSIDTAKMLNLYTTYPTQDFKDYVAPPTGLGKTIPGPLKPLIAIPTTAGTGSENTPVAIVDLEKEKLKVGISHQYLLPSLALLDPVLTVTLSSYYTASTGMDALLHSIEAYTSLPFYARKRPDSPDKRPVYIGANPVSDLFVEKSIELVGKYLRRACHNPYDLEARTNMLLAAHLGGAFGTEKRGQDRKKGEKGDRLLYSIFYFFFGLTFRFMVDSKPNTFLILACHFLPI
ncbi:Alcohol dehydrogenase [Desulfurella amilsii]|uniref:hydroxyacid-oxoacid transhydrogenase n=1 Tax=Desulfurella amilsii TaxID=1562698 RepID=A0A1X4XUU6_9BACT|nr:hydroxyacid-oxoacid transhydrogenase [Desulfurella amilsii]OSS41313.1 Alcohol dehydrogenase [Desulfurella amilsii]